MARQKDIDRSQGLLITPQLSELVSDSRWLVHIKAVKLCLGLLSHSWSEAFVGSITLRLSETASDSRRVWLDQMQQSATGFYQIG